MSASSRRRRLVVATAVATAILVPAIQQGGGFGMDQATFAAQGDSTLRAPGFAFAIWTIIYLGLGVYAVYQSRARDSRALRVLAWPAAIAALGCAAWIVAAALNQMWLSVAVILVSAAAAVTGLVQAKPLAGGRDRLFAILPIALLAGWLTTAAPLNILTALTAKGFVTPATAPAYALAAVAAAVVVGAAVSLRAGSRSYPLPIAWGLAAIYVAERADKPTIALVAAAAAGLMLLTSAAVAFKQRHP
jgi:hypothetical protein